MHFLSFKILFLFTILATCSKINAQNCGTHHTSKESPTFFSNYRNTTVKIPVVVHIVYNEDEQNISDEQIFSQIEVLNQDFRKNNNQDDLPTDFKAVAADTEIMFFLAEKDPNGKKTNGITRTFTTSKNVWQEKAVLNGVAKQKVYFTNIEGKNAWNTACYLNIWVCKMPDGKSGYATFPAQTLTSQEDGIVVDYRYFGTKGTAALNAPFHLGRTCTHEIGHYLNLSHIWGDGTGDNTCNTDDGVSDTPLQSAPVAGCPSAAVKQCGKVVMHQNFMNYTHDNCMSLFTEGQKQRMWAAMSQYRKCFIDNGVNVNESQLADIQVFPNPVSDILHIVVPHEADCFLLNAQGQVMMKHRLVDGKNELDVSNLSNGFYQIGIKVENTQLIKKINVLH